MEKNRTDLKFTKGMGISISNSKESYEIGIELLSSCREQNDKHGMAKAYLLLAYSGQFLGFYAQSYEYVNLSIPLLIQCNDSKNLASAYNTLGFIYYYFDDHENRLEVNLKSLKISKAIGDEEGYLRSLNNTGDTYLKLGKHKEALKFFNKTLDSCAQDKRMMSIVLSNIAETNLFLKNYEKALDIADLSIKQATEIRLFDLIFHNLYIKSHVYNDLKKWNKSIDQLEFALEVLNGNEGTNEKDLIDLYKSSSIAFEESGQFTQSLKWLKKHFEIDKTIQDEKQKKEIKSIKFKKEITNLQNRTTELELTISERTQQLEQALETEKHVSYFTQELTNTNTIEEVLWKLVKSCISKLHLEDCVVYIVDEDRAVLTQKAAFGPKDSNQNQIEGPIEIRVGNGIVGYVAQSGRHEIINDTSKDMRYIVDDDIRSSELAVPIFYEKKVIGVIDSEHSKKNFFNERHVSLFKMLASLVESRMGKLKEQEAKNKLQEKIIALNESLERKIRKKSKENTQLNHKILEQEKKAIIGEMSTIITHELNTPLASIKGGNEAILFLLNRILTSRFIERMTKTEIDFIIEKTKISSQQNKNTSHTVELNKEGILKLKNIVKDKNLINSIQKLNIIKSKEVEELLSFKNIELTLMVIKDIFTIINFNEVIGKSVSRASNVVEELKSLAAYDENPEKRKILLINNFEGFQVHFSLSHPEARFELNIEPGHLIHGNEFRTIQLWSNIIHLIIDNCKFIDDPTFVIGSKLENDKTTILIECRPQQIMNDMFNSNILNYRFNDDIEGSEKLKLNIIQSILVEHRAKLRCSMNDELIQFKLMF
ncbi:MAG: GAF domain-containing protein [Crocinitomicaceae bacterium]|nr:GAF domain-containing protein [Crocinitomicaceae bacterium]